MRPTPSASSRHTTTWLTRVVEATRHGAHPALQWQAAKQTPGSLAGTGRWQSAEAERSLRDYSSPLVHGNAVEIEKMARASLLETSSGVPSSVLRSLPSTHFRPKSKWLYV